MTVVPLVQFKAGKCEVNEDTNPWRIKPKNTPGFIYLYKEEDLTHFCWRPRVAPIDDPGSESLDLIMFAGDGQFEPFEVDGANGRFYKLGFQSSSAKHFFWLQSKAQGSSASSSEWSNQDYTLGKIVSEILGGEEVNAREVYQMAAGQRRNTRPADDDTEMRDADDDESPARGGSNSGAKGDSTTGGGGSQQGGEDGARTNVIQSNTRALESQVDTQSAVDNFLKSLQGNPSFANSSSRGSFGKIFTTLPELLKPQATLDTISFADSTLLDDLLLELPTELRIKPEPTPVDSTAAAQLTSQISGNRSVEERRDILRKAIRSPQFTQSLTSLTSALRDGGLPAISEVLGVRVRNGGLEEHGNAPISGGDAIEAFLQGIRDLVSREDES